MVCSLSAVSSFIRRVPTASGATAVQIMHKKGREVVGIEHIGSAHNDVDLALLMEVARQRLHAGQDELDLGWESEAATGGGPGQRPTVSGQRSELLIRAVAGAYAHLGFDSLDDEAFWQLVLARIVEPTSKVDSIRVLEEIGLSAVSERTMYRCLARVIERDYRGTLAGGCMAHAARTSGATVLLYDVTTLHFETDAEDDLRKVGMSKQRRVDPQIQVGLLVDRAGFPLEVQCFPGNKAETRTLVPILDGFKQRHGVTDLVVVADAGMLSAANLNALEDAGYRFIVGSRITKAPYDLAEHFQAKGNYFTDGQVLESSRVMGSAAQARSRRVVYQWRFKRAQRDQRTLNAQIERAEKVAAGTSPLKRDRFVKIDGATRGVDWPRVERARQLAGLKGYVSNISHDTMSGLEVITAYHDLFNVEASFRMAKSDLRARPIFHRKHDSIEAHLTIVFAALAVSRLLQDLTGLSIKRLIRTLRPLRSVTINLAGNQITATPELTEQTKQLLNQLPWYRGD